MNQDRDQLKLLSIFHYILGGIMGLFSCVPLIHLFLGIIFVFAPDTMKDSRGNGPPAFIGWFFIVFALVFIIAGWILAICTLYAGRCLAKTKKYLFCFVTAAIMCVFMPFGTVLGVFTIIVLMRPTVKDLFSVNYDPYKT
ncbi:MAG TPA: hypothetical protein PL110_15975 [Candidatus Eremiobacteraeota bacterium]|mgnify:CR=1 FL=1|nr:hypothetical protein [Candidatus Eremiobacteraeota bacterium]